MTKITFYLSKPIEEADKKEDTQNQEQTTSVHVIMSDDRDYTFGIGSGSNGVAFG